MRIARVFLVAMGLGFGAWVVAGDAPKSQWDGVYTQGQSKRGEALYTGQCAECHGADLLGGEMAPALIGGQFQGTWNEQSLGDLFFRIRTSMPLNSPGSLSKTDTADILSYMLAKGGYPSGESELATQTDYLLSIKFLAAKP